MNAEGLVSTRRSLHAVAELLLAGPAYDRDGDIRLRATPGGFGVWQQPGSRVEGTDLVVDGGRVPIIGSIAGLADAIGGTPRSLSDVYPSAVDVALDEPLRIDPAAAAELAAAFELGDAALTMLAPEAERVLWPEHFDIACTVGKINFGVSPGDSFLTVPYAYVGPWRVPTGDFWNAPFGAARALSEFTDCSAVAAFFERGRSGAGS
ncbi:MAG: hypothetical protein ABJD68_09920 [Nakamurella sp.]